MNTMLVQSRPARQRGAVLMVGMVMVLMITLIALSVIRLTARHTQVVNNEQVRTEATAAANFGLDTVLNQSFATGNWAQYSGSAGANINVNLGIRQSADANDGTGAVPVKVNNLVSKRCRRIMNSELFSSDGSITVKNKQCIYTPQTNLSIGTASTGSACSTVLYEMQAGVDTANAADMLGASTPVIQGVDVLIGGGC